MQEMENTNMKASFITKRLFSLFLTNALAAMALLGSVNAMAQVEKARLRIISKPADAIVYIDNQQRGTSPLTIDIRPGEHLVLVQKSNYESNLQTINIKPAQVQTSEIHLKPIKGLVLIHSTPSGVDVEVDGASRGKTPLFVSDLPLGRYRAKFTKPGYMPKEIELNINKRTPVKYNVTLTPDSATLFVDSIPQDATVTINGINRGKTPCTIERIPSGETTLELDLQGYKHYKERLVLAAGDKEQVMGNLNPIPSSLEIITTPPDARIYVNNQYRGTSPLKLKQLSPGTYRVRAEKRAYDIMARDIVVGRAQKLTEEFRLKTNAGAIEITTEPAGVKVLLDGKCVGITATKSNRTDRISLPLSVKLIPSGQKTMKLIKPGYFSKTVNISIDRDQTFTSHYKLKRRFIPNYEIKTKRAVYRGVLISVDAQRNVKMETSPGIFKTIKHSDMVSSRPLREDETNKEMHK